MASNFRVTIKHRNGKIEVINVHAENEQAATSIGRRKGAVISIKKGSGAGLFEIPLLAEERQMLLHRLASMLASKLGTSEALDVIRSSFGGRIRKVANLMLTHMESGADIVESIEKIGQPHFPNTTIALIKAGSKGGDTWKALRDAAEFEVEMERVKKGGGQGVWGGVAGFVIAAFVTFGARFYVAPNVMESNFFKMAAESVDLSFVHLMSNVVGYSMALFFSIFLFLFLLGSIGRWTFPTQADAIILRIPFYKDLVLARSNYIVLYGLAVMIRSGVSMEQSLSLSASSTRKGSLKDDLERAIDAIKKGKPWAQMMHTFHATDRAALSVSADKEQIASTLDALSYQYREDYKRVISSFGPSMQLLAALYLVLASGILFGYTMLPMLQVAASGF